MSAPSSPVDMPDMKKGGMTSAEKGEGMLHNLHFGEMVLNHPTTKKLLKALGVGLAMARKMKPEELMSKVKELIAKLPSKAEGGVADVPPPRANPVAKAPPRKKGGMSSASAPVRVSPTKDAPARKKGGMSSAPTPGRVNPAKDSPSRKKGGLSAVYEAKDRASGRVPGHDQI